MVAWTLPEPLETEFGFRARFLPSDDPNVLLAESWTRPVGGGGALHRHLHQNERFDVLDGAITAAVTALGPRPPAPA